MIHNYQKRWTFTWNSDESDPLIDYKILENLLNEITVEGVFQKEKGLKTCRTHYQGRFKLKGPRIGKRRLLEIFSQIGCISNLTFSPERLNDSTAYCTKSLGRLEGPWFVGIDSYRAKNSRM